MKTVPFFAVEQEFLVFDSYRNRLWNEINLVRMDRDYEIAEPIPPVWEVPVLPRLSTMITELDISSSPMLKTYRFTREEIISQSGFKFTGYVFEGRCAGPWPRSLRRHVFRAWYTESYDRRWWRFVKREVAKRRAAPATFIATEYPKQGGET